MHSSGTIIRCPYCGSVDGIFVARKYPQESLEVFFESGFSQYHCQECGLYYCAPLTPEVLEGLERYFAEYYNNKDRIYDPAEIVAQTWKPSPVRDLLRSLYRTFYPQKEYALGRAGEGMKILRAHGVRTLLDVGCSYGAFVRSAIQCGIDAYGVEPNREVVSLIRQCGVDKVAAGFFPYETGALRRYDAITFFQVLMYLHDVTPAFFRRCRETINPGGVLLVFATDPIHHATPEVQAAMTAPLVVNFTGENFMCRAARDAGFSEYRYVPCLGEPTKSFHILTV